MSLVAFCLIFRFPEARGPFMILEFPFTYTSKLLCVLIPSSMSVILLFLYFRMQEIVFALAYLALCCLIWFGMGYFYLSIGL